jgi:hypothetical protein
MDCDVCWADAGADRKIIDKNKEVKMPYGDGTGPEGQGSLTGRGMGFCAGNARPGSYEPRFGLGIGRRFGRGRGGGFGRFPRFWGYNPLYRADNPEMPVAAPAENLEALKQQHSWLHNQLEALSRRISELAGEKDSK